jgi:hypothetical protein
VRRGERQWGMLCEAGIGKLEANGHKPHWKTFTNVDYFFRRIEQELLELKSAALKVVIFGFGHGEVLKEAADVCNFVLMLCDAVGEFEEEG